MSEYKRTATCIVEWENVRQSSPKSTTFRDMVYMACLQALALTDIDDVTVLALNAGIVLKTSEGERFPHTWRELTLVVIPKRLSPRHFTSAIMNSAAGHCAIELGLIGPQLVLVEGDVGVAAEIQLDSGRTRLLFVCSADMGYRAECYIMEAIDD